MVDDMQDHYGNFSVIPQEQLFIKTSSIYLVSKKTTRGWEVLVEFKDGSSNYII